MEKTVIHENPPKNETTKDTDKPKQESSCGNCGEYEISKSDLQKIRNSPISIIRNIFLTYALFVGGCVLFVVGFSTVTFTFYVIVYTDGRDINQFSKFGAKFASYIFLMLLLFIISKIINCIFGISQSIWTNPHGMYHNTTNSFFSFFGIKSDNNACYVIALKYLFKITCGILLEFIPLIITAVFVFKNGPGNFIMPLQLYIVISGCSMIVFGIICWFGEVINNYKHIILSIIAIFQYKKIDNNNENDAKDGNNDEIKVIEEESKDDKCKKNDNIKAKTINRNTSIFVNVIYFFWYYAPFTCFETLTLRTLFYFIFSLIGFVFCAWLQSFNDWWMLLIMVGVLWVLMIVDLFIRLLYIPKISPNNERFKKYKEKENVLSYFVAIYEEFTFKQAPGVVFTDIKIQFYGLILIVTFISVILQSTIWPFFFPILTSGVVFLLYILRFNTPSFINNILNCKKRETKEKKEEEEEEVKSIHDINSSDVYRNENKILRVISVLGYFLHIFLWLLIFVIFSGIFLNWWTFFFSLILAFAAVGVVFDKYNSKRTHITNIIFTFFIIVFALVLFVGIPKAHISDPLTTEEEQKYQSYSNRRIPVKINDTDTRYEVCDIRWNGLTVLELAMVSHFGLSNVTRFKFKLNYSSLSDFKFHYSSNSEEKGITFHELYSSQRNMSIIVVRGTKSMRDWIQDLYLWKEIIAFQMFSYFSPILITMGDDLTRQVINIISNIENFFITQGEKYYDDLVNHIEKRKIELNATSNSSSTYMVITGTSLGGGLGKIAAALTKINAVSFVGPGISLSCLKYGIASVDQINKHVVNVNTQNDFASMIDKTSGFTQTVECYLPGARCHNVGRIKGYLKDNCEFKDVEWWHSYDN